MRGSVAVKSGRRGSYAGRLDGLALGIPVAGTVSGVCRSEGAQSDVLLRRPIWEHGADGHATRAGAEADRVQEVGLESRLSVQLVEEAWLEVSGRVQAPRRLHGPALLGGRISAPLAAVESRNAAEKSVWVCTCKQAMRAHQGWGYTSPYFSSTARAADRRGRRALGGHSA